MSSSTAFLASVGGSSLSGGPIVFNITPSVSGLSTWSVGANGPLNLSSGTYTITPTTDFNANVVMWGAAGGNHFGNPGGAGGCSIGTVRFLAGVSYRFIVGNPGTANGSGRAAPGSGGGTGIEMVSGSLPIMVAGGGAGAKGVGPGGRGPGAGGGESGQNGDPTGAGGFGGSQAGPGAGGNGGRRVGASGVGRNGGAGNTGSFHAAGGTGFGDGGFGTYNGGDDGSTGGGGGYYGGGEGGGDSGAFAGGGGSGHINSTYVTGATYTGYFEIPPLSSHPNRGNAGYSDNNGRIYLSGA